MSLIRRSARIATALVGCGALALTSASAAEASSPATTAARHGGQIPVISLDMTEAGGFSLPSNVPSGLVTFKVTSPEDGFHAFQGLRINPGYTLDDILYDLTLGLSDDSAQNALGHQLLLQQAVLVGGVVTSPEGPISFTAQLEPGTYYFLDLNDFFLTGLAPRVHTLQARGALPSGGALPAYDAVIVGTMGADHMPIFQNVPATFGHNGTFLFVNASDELHEAVFRPTRPGITDQYITDFYNAVVSGDPNRPPSPWIGRQRGLQALSPGRIAWLHIELNTGPNAMICYVPSDEAGPPENGLPHAYIGMHTMLDLT